jgi:hypothetical protein
MNNKPKKEVSFFGEGRNVNRLAAGNRQPMKGSLLVTWRGEQWTKQATNTCIYVQIDKLYNSGEESLLRI